MARPRQLDLQLQNINDVVEHALLLAEADIKASGVEVQKGLTSDLPMIEIDRRACCKRFSTHAQWCTGNV
jgi:hypothetical protein